MLENLIFISYRRADAASHAMAMKMELEGRLRAAQVFVDTQQIQGGDRRSREIEVALRPAGKGRRADHRTRLGRPERGRCASHRRSG